MRLSSAFASLFVVTCLAGCGGGSETQPPPQHPPPQPYNGGANAPPAQYGSPYGAPAGAPPPNTGMNQPVGAPNTGMPNTPPNTGTPNTGAGAPPPMGIPGLPPMPTSFGMPQAAPSGPAATPIDPNFAGAAGAALGFIASTDAAGMQKEGAPLAGQFAEGQVLEQQITIQPGKCYAIVAAGVGPQELEVTLLPQSPIPGLPAIGSAKGTGQKTVMGGGGNCVRLALMPVAVPAKWVLKSTRGGGLVAGQLYVK